MKQETIFDRTMNLKSAVVWPPFVVFSVLIAVTVVVFFSTKVDIRTEQEAALEKYAEQVETAVAKRLDLFGESLYSGAAFFQASKFVAQSEWDEYIARKGSLERFAGAQGIGYAAVIRPNELSAYNAQTQNDVYPEGDREIYTAIKFISPKSDRNEEALGYDMFSDETRRVAMEQARDSGGVFMTDDVTLVQEDGEDTQKGILLYAAHYGSDVTKADVSEKRQALEGYFYAAFRMNDFVRNAISPVTGQEITDGPVAITVYSGSLEKSDIIFQSENYERISEANTDTNSIRDIDIYGSRLIFEYTYSPAGLVPNSIGQRPQTVLVFGIFASALIAAVTFLLLRIKANELELSAQQNTNEAKDSLLSIASHQLRTPATGVKQYIGMVLQGFSGDISDRQRAMLEKAYDSNERQLRTINDVLYLARLDSGRIVLSKGKVDLVELVHSVVDEQQDSIKENQHTLSLKLPKKPLIIFGDEHMLRMCVENLLSNAIKYTPARGKISLSILVEDQSVRIIVADNGVGIDKGDQDELLFRQFSRISNELTKSVSGTGIGLYLVKHLVELHGGFVKVESEENKGSIFSIELPLETNN